MLSYLLRRLIYIVVTVLFISVAGFVIINLPPGSYLDYYIARLEEMGTSTAENQIETLKRQYGLDQPAYIQGSLGFGVGRPHMVCSS